MININDIEALWRKLDVDEKKRAEALIPVVEKILRQEAYKVGKDLDKMMEQNEKLVLTEKSVVVDIIARALMTSTNNEPMSQFSQSAGGYVASGTYLVPGGGIFIKNSELARLGLKRQRIGVLDVY